MIHRWIRSALAGVLVTFASGCVRWESHPMDPVCWGLACDDCMTNLACAWDLTDRVCRKGTLVPDNHAQSRELRTCPASLDRPDGAITPDATPSPDAHNVDATTAPDAPPPALAAVRLVNALPDGGEIDLCIRRPSESAFVSLAAQPGGRLRILYGHRTGDLAIGPSGTYTLRLVRGGATCDRANALLGDFNSNFVGGEPQWLVALPGAMSPVMVRFAVRPPPNDDGRLRLRWLLARPAVSETTFTYATPGATFTWTANATGEFGANADSAPEDGTTLLPAATPAARPSATAAGVTITADRAIPMATGSYTLVLVAPPDLSPLPGVWLLLPERDRLTGTQSAVW